MKEQIHIFPNARMAQIAAVAGGNTFIDWSNGSIKFGTKQNVLEIPETIALAFCIPNLWVRTYGIFTFKMVENNAIKTGIR